MYQIQWDKDTRGFLLVDSRDSWLSGEIRPVFFEELDLLGFERYWSYPRVYEPLLWALGGRKYYYDGELVAEVEGGGLFSDPTLRIHRPGLSLEPTALETMIAKNNVLLQGLVQRSLKFIWQTHSRYKSKVDIAAVAFSGGKDSLVALDLVQRALEPDQFVVVFGDTGMEIRDTYRAVEEAARRWPHLTFHTARSAKDVLTTWREMGPPSRIHRWCCVVHKTAPTLLLLRQLAGKPSVKALIFDGVRHEESVARSSYAQITSGGKHRLQTNASPLISWSAAEVFLYLFSRSLMLNQAYRRGAVRVGCAVCPMAAHWWDVIGWRAYRDDLRPLVDELRTYAIGLGVALEETDNYLERGNWKNRAGGRCIPGGGNRVTELRRASKVIFTLRHPREEWQRWARALGRLVQTGEDEGVIERNGTVHHYSLTHRDSSVVIEVDGLETADRYELSAFRAVALKSAYCAHCGACDVECPTGALATRDRVRIDDACTSCGSCLGLRGEACLAAKSLATSEGVPSVSGDQRRILHTYQHFGMRREWLADFYACPSEWLSRNALGTMQFEAMLAWLRHAELIAGSKRSPSVTRLGERLSRRGIDDLTAWAVIWANLVRNSAPVRWYAASVPWGAVLTKADALARIGETYYAQSESTRKNAVTALFGLLTKTPLGNELGLGVSTSSGRGGDSALHKRGWREPEAVAVLYALYRYAESTGRYELTVHELYETAEEGPYTVFGIDAETLKGLLRGLATRATGFVRVDIVRDLDNVFLDHTRSASEVLDLA